MREFLLKYAWYIELAFVILVYIIIYTLVKKTYKKINTLFIEERYDECRIKIDFMLQFLIGYNKQNLMIMRSMILINEKKYGDAILTLQGVKHTKLVKKRDFWLCFSFIISGEIEKAKDIFIQSEKLFSVDDIEYKVLDAMFSQYGNAQIVLEEELLSRLNNKVLIKYFNEQKYNLTNNMD